MNMSVAAKSRIIIQQCLSASLKTNSDPEEFVKIGRGIVVYICFLKGATEEILPKIVQTILKTKLSEASDGSLTSVSDLKGDILIVPQATLGGKIKGKAVQYHHNIDKETGRVLYTQFLKLCETSVESASLKVDHGIYGSKQVLKMDTNGPFTHVVDFE